jgi:hypothetical protein
MSNIELTVVDPFGLCSRSEAKPEEEWVRVWTGIKTLEAELKALQEIIKADKQRLALICPHPEHQVEDKVKHIQASYYDPSETVRWRQCNVCGTSSEKVTTRGGFG